MVLIGFCGSRALPPSASSLVSAVAARVLSSRLSPNIAVGCCVGLDQRVVSTVISAGEASRLFVFAAFGPASPPGKAPGASASISWPSGVAAALAAGASVSWWSGGDPAVPLHARLAGRSAALVFAVATSGPGACLVAFVRDPCPPHLRPTASASAAFSGHGSGSWGSLALAAGLGLPVVVFPLHPSGYGPALPILWPGSWSPINRPSLAAAFRFVPASPSQTSLFG